MAEKSKKLNVLLVGAGLSNCLLAWFLTKRRPELKLLLVEANPSMAKEKTWSFHGQDLDVEFEDLGSLIEKSWPGYEVTFPKYHRSFVGTYHSLRPAHVEKAMRECLGENLKFSTRVRALAKDHIVLEDGTAIQSDCIIDGRGAHGAVKSGYQKFVGLHVRLSKPHGLVKPLLMDAKVSQKDGYRFIYLLPWSKSEILIEDTRYSNSPIFDVEEMQADINEYVADQSWKIDEVLEVESSALPIPIDKVSVPSADDQIPRVGMSGGFFHPVTGYSLPDAVRLADQISRLSEISSRSVLKELIEYSESRRSQMSYFRMLNRMMFLAAKPEERYKIFEHFYRLPEPTISRFYRGQLTITDRIRILSGRPPVAMLPAMKSLLNFGQGART